MTKGGGGPNPRPPPPAAAGADADALVASLTEALTRVTDSIRAGGYCPEAIRARARPRVGGAAETVVRTRDWFLSPRRRARVVLRLRIVRVFLVTRANRGATMGTVGVTPTHRTPAQVGRRSSPCPLTPSCPFLPLSRGHLLRPAFTNLPSSVPRCLP